MRSSRASEKRSKDWTRWILQSFEVKKSRKETVAEKSENEQPVHEATEPRASGIPKAKWGHCRKEEE